MSITESVSKAISSTLIATGGAIMTVSVWSSIRRASAKMSKENLDAFRLYATSISSRATGWTSSPMSYATYMAIADDIFVMASLLGFVEKDPTLPINLGCQGHPCSVTVVSDEGES